MEQRPGVLCERCQRQTAVRLLHPINPKLLHSNYLPSETEVASALQELKQCEADIGVVRRQLEQLEAHKRQLEPHIMHCRSIVSAQRRVPAEIWEIIFTFVCSFTSKDGYSLIIPGKPCSENAVVKTPVALSRVCFRWRTIATGCPRLWSSISIVFYRLSMSAESLLRTFLTNSADYPLDICLATLLDKSAWSKHHNLAILRIISRHFSRCNRLFIEAGDHTFFSGFQGLHLPAFHNLSSLSLRFRHPSVSRLNGNNRLWKALLNSTSKLTKVSVDDDLSRYPPDFLPYHQLTTLSINGVGVNNIEDLLRALEASKNLHSLTLLQVQSYDQSVHTAARRVGMPSLQTLVIRTEMDSPLFGVLFSSLVVPNLSTFELRSSSSYSSRTTWPPSLLTMLESASTTLRRMSLILGHAHILDTWKPLSLLLKMTPHITHLEIGGGETYVLDNGDHSESFGYNTLIGSSVADLTADMPQNTLLPHLECLALHYIQLNSEFMGQILALATSRSPSRFSAVHGIQHPLTKLRILSYNGGRLKFVLKPHILEVIRELEEDGVKVVFDRTNMYYDPSKHHRSTSFQW